MHKQFTNQTAKKTGLSPFCSLPDLPVHLCLCEHHLCWLFDGDQMSIPLSFLSLPLCSSPQLSIPPSPAPSLHSGQLADFICDTCFARRSLSPQNIWIVSKASYFWECVGCRGLLLSLGLPPPTHTHTPLPQFFFLTTCCSLSVKMPSSKKRGSNLQPAWSRKDEQKVKLINLELFFSQNARKEYQFFLLFQYFY